MALEASYLKPIVKGSIIYENDLTQSKFSKPQPLYLNNCGTRSENTPLHAFLESLTRFLVRLI